MLPQDFFFLSAFLIKAAFVVLYAFGMCCHNLQALQFRFLYVFIIFLLGFPSVCSSYCVLLNSLFISVCCFYCISILFLDSLVIFLLWLIIFCVPAQLHLISLLTQLLHFPFWHNWVVCHFSASGSLFMQVYTENVIVHHKILPLVFWLHVP